MKIEDTNIYFKKSLLNKGIITTEELVKNIESSPLFTIKGANYNKLIDGLFDLGCISEEKSKILKCRHTVIKDYNYVTPLALSSDKMVGNYLLSKLYEYVAECGLPQEYVAVVMFYRVCKSQGNFLYFLEHGMSKEGKDFIDRLDDLCIHLCEIKETDSIKYKMIGYLFSGVGNKIITNKTGIEDIQGYYQNLLKEMESWILVREGYVFVKKQPVSNANKIKSKESKVNVKVKEIKDLNLSVNTLFMLKRLGIFTMNDLTTAIREGTLMMPSKNYMEIVNKLNK